MKKGKDELIYTMREALTEAAQRINCKIQVNQDENDFTVILLINKSGYPIYKAYDVSSLFGFIHGFEYCYKNN